MAKLERRDLASPVELQRAAPGRSPNRLVGYAAKFGVESAPLHDFAIGGAFVEVIRAGAFSRTLRENPDIRALYNHDTNIVLGRTKSGTLRLREDATGLHFEVDLPDTSAGRDVKAMVKRGDVDGCSFGFMVVEDDVEERDGKRVRTLVDVELVEISPAVAFPAYAETEVALRHSKGQVTRGTPRLDLAVRRLRMLELDGRFR